MCVSSRWLVTVVARSEMRPIGIMFWSVCTVAVQKGLVFHEIILFVILIGNLVVVPHNLNGICFLQFMKLQLNPASSNILPPDGSSPVTQMISVNNSLYGQVSITQNSIDSWHQGWGSFQFQNLQLWQAFVGSHKPKRLIIFIYCCDCRNL
jgi:hypothetical protein